MVAAALSAGACPDGDAAGDAMPVAATAMPE
jgi:hypothetical protein